MNPKELIPGCQHFTWKEALYLPQWKLMADESTGVTEEIKANLIKTFQWMEKVREWIGSPISVHIAWRSEDYNALVKGAKTSQHLYGNAVDFSVPSMTCDAFKAKMLAENKLEEWNLRMEDNGAGAGWIHLDDRQPGPAGRFFKP